MLIDTHCHLHFPEFDEDRAATLGRAAAAGVGHCVTIGTDLETSRRSVALARQTPGVSAAVGWHPHDAQQWTEEGWSELGRLSADPTVVAIGEIGLDYYRDLSPRPAQQEVFRRMIRLAREHQLPVVLHSREAHADLLAILREEWTPPLRGVMHCFSGDAALVERCVAMGLYISFACNLLYKSSGVLREAAIAVPEDRLLTETDAPFLSPPDRRGRRNEPSAVRAVAEGLAALRSVSVEALAASAARNAAALFGRRLQEPLAAAAAPRSVA